MPPWDFGDQTLSAWSAAVTALHVGLRAGLIDENQALDVQFALRREPGATLFSDIFAVLFGGPL